MRTLLRYDARAAHQQAVLHVCSSVLGGTTSTVGNFLGPETTYRLLRAREYHQLEFWLDTHFPS
jgi:hypothetical protein